MAKAERVGVYPGTFDPLTLGHVDIIRRAALLFDRLVIGVATSEAKSPLLPFADRLALASQEAATIGAELGVIIEARPLTGLMVAFAAACDAAAVVRGLRVGADFDYELQMAGMNHRLAPHIETVFLMASEGRQCLSSTLVREIARMGGEVAGFVPPATLVRLRACLRDQPGQVERHAAT